MLFRPILAATLLCPSSLVAQAPGRWPPDTLRNLQVIPRGTPVPQVIGVMRDFSFHLGVRCEFCHVGREDQPLTEFDFASDDKRTKRVARQMMRMVQEINRRLDTLPDRVASGLQVTCRTCHREVSRPVPLSSVIAEAAETAGLDSALRAYRMLRERHYGGDAYNFGESSLNVAAFRLGRGRRFPEAFGLLVLNEEYFPQSSGMYVFRGNISLMQGDTTTAADAFREAIRRDPRNEEARLRLRTIGREP